MITCRYVGKDFSEVGDREFSSIGEVAMFSERTFVEAVVGGCSLIPEKRFKALQIPDVELEEFGKNLDEAPESFLFKVGLAQAAYRDLRASLSSGKSFEQYLSEIASEDLVESAA